MELKDYRQHRRAKPLPLPDEVAIKVRDTVAGLWVASNRDGDANADEPRACIRAHKVRVVLHLEQPRVHSKLFPRSHIPANVLQRLRQLVRVIDPHPKVIDLTHADVPWTVAPALGGERS